MMACLNTGLAQSSTEKVVQAAGKFLATLSDGQRQKVEYSFSDGR
jgi:hypothetical protein